MPFCIQNDLKVKKMDFRQNDRPKLIFCQDSKQYELTRKIFFSGALKCVNQVTNLISSIFHGKIAFSENFVDAWSEKIFKKSIFFDFLKNASNHTQASYMDQKRVLNTLGVSLMQFLMIYTSFKHILRKSNFCKKWIFCDFSTKFYFQKITVLVTKRHKNFKFFFKLKNMDHKLSNDVFGISIRLLVQIL